MAGPDPVGVVLMDLGGPSGPDEIRPFIESLMSDPAILHMPGPPRRLLARLIARSRAPKVARRYEALGGRSPLHESMASLVAAVARAFGEPGFLVRHAFRHAEPRAETTLAALRDEGARRAVCVPVFPQRSLTTAGTCLGAFGEAARRLDVEPLGTRSFPEAEGYLAAVEDRAREAAREADHVLLTAHGLPESHVRRGDPYLGEVEASAEALGPRLGERWSLAFQSRLGPVRWLGPHLEEEIARLAGEGVRRLAVVPISFGCENLETCWDLDVRAAEIATQEGITSYARAPTPGDHPRFAALLAELVREASAEAGSRLPGGEP